MKTKPVDCFVRHKGAYRDVYNRMCWKKPSPTITTRFNSLSNGRFGHPEEDRAISLREGALFQTFPIGYKFYGSMATITKHIGNAVPVKLAEIFGLHFIEIIQKGD
jgi:DNA (cytosine-5)-methyltransferase 1